MGFNWKDIVDRTVSTAVQAFVGSATAITAAGGIGALAEWRTAGISAAVAALVALTKAIGISVNNSSGKPVVTVVPGSPAGDAVQSAETLAAQVAARLSAGAAK